jgi:hypothetical protein
VWGWSSKSSQSLSNLVVPKDSDGWFNDGLPRVAYPGFGGGSCKSIISPWSSAVLVSELENLSGSKAGSWYESSSSLVKSDSSWEKKFDKITGLNLVAN